MAEDDGNLAEKEEGRMVLALLKDLSIRIQDEAKARQEDQKETTSILAKLQEASNEAVRRLTILNGGQDRNTQAIAKLELELAKHPLECALRKEIDAIKEKIQAAATEKKTDAKWHARFAPYLKGVIAAAVVVMLLHIKEILEWLGVIKH